MCTVEPEVCQEFFQKNILTALNNLLPDVSIGKCIWGLILLIKVPPLFNRYLMLLIVC